MKKTRHTEAVPKPSKPAGKDPAAIAKPSKSKVGSAVAPPAKEISNEGESTGPSAMDLLQIARWFGLITPQLMKSPNVHDDAEPVMKCVPQNHDQVFRSQLHDAAHLYFLANTVAKRCQQEDLWGLRGAQEKQQEREFQLRRIWACAEGGALLSGMKAYLKLDYKSYSGFSRFLREFGYIYYEGGNISEGAIRILRIIKDDQKRQKEAARKKTARAQKEAAGGKSCMSPTQIELNQNPEIAHRNLLQILENTFEGASVSVDANLFAELSIRDI